MGQTRSVKEGWTFDFGGTKEGMELRELQAET